MSWLPNFLRFGGPSKEASKDAMETCEVVLKEIGADLHDDLIQKLSVLRLHMDKIERSSYNPQETQQTLIKMQTDFQSIVDSVRRISRQLHPVHMQDDPFDKRVEVLCQNLDMPGTIRIYPSFEGEPLSLTETQQSYLLRMIQELIHNSFRHSSAWNLWVKIIWSPNSLIIKVEDDGSGFARLEEFVEMLKRKYNTLRMRAETIGASIKYQKGEQGLLAIIKLQLS